MVKPLLKWAGGKRWLVAVLQQLWQSYSERKLVEPFTGGMAVALGLQPQYALLNDVNEHLINFYQQVRSGLKINFRLKNNADYYYKMRAKFNNLVKNGQHLTKDAAGIFYYLIRTGFNGLCRFNNSGEFNVPFGNHNTINYRTDFFEYQPILANWQLQCADFQQLAINSNDFLYVDPPYDVEFTKYHTIDFVWADQQRLAAWLYDHPGPVVASNQATPRIIQLYQELDFNIFTLAAPRSISCTGNRQPATEILTVRGFKRADLKALRLDNIHY